MSTQLGLYFIEMLLKAAEKSPTGLWPSLIPPSLMMCRMPMRMSSPLPPPRGRPAIVSRAYRRTQGSGDERACSSECVREYGK